MNKLFLYLIKYLIDFMNKHIILNKHLLSFYNITLFQIFKIQVRSFQSKRFKIFNNFIFEFQ